MLFLRNLQRLGYILEHFIYMYIYIYHSQRILTNSLNNLISYIYIAIIFLQTLQLRNFLSILHAVICNDYCEYKWSLLISLSLSPSIPQSLSLSLPLSLPLSLSCTHQISKQVGICSRNKMHITCNSEQQNNNHTSSSINNLCKLKIMINCKTS